MATGPSAYLQQPRTAELRWMGDTSTYFLAAGEQTGEAFALVEERALRGESVPLHLHGDDAESLYVLEGELMLYIGDQPGVGKAPDPLLTSREGRCTASGSSRRPRAISC